MLHVVTPPLNCCVFVFFLTLFKDMPLSPTESISLSSTDSSKPKRRSARLANLRNKETENMDEDQNENEEDGSDYGGVTSEDSNET